MNAEQVTMVRIYLHEGEGQVRNLLRRLHDWEKLRGVTVFRGVSGYGDSGHIVGADLLDLSLDLPVVVEFYDNSEKIKTILQHLSPTVKPGHMVWWDVNMTI